MTPDEIVEFVEELARIAAAGNGAKALAAYLAEATNTSVLLENARWEHLATAGAAVAHASAKHLIDARSPERRTFRAHRNGAPGRTLAIVSGSTHLGWLSIFAHSGGDELDRIAPLARLAASAIAVELAREGERGPVRGFWERVASGTYGDLASARDDATSRGIVLAPHYLSIALELDAAEEERDGDAAGALRSIVTDVFRHPDAALGLFERESMLVVFVPVAREIDAEKATTAATFLPKSIAKRTAAFRVTGGVGSIEPLMRLPHGLERAHAALTITRRMRGSGHVGTYGTLGPYPLLLGDIRLDDLRAFAETALAPLRAYDERHQTELERTLRRYFETGENVKTTAADLCVHRHTVFYRLRQIAEITTRRLEDHHDQLTLRLAMAIDALHHER